MSDISVTKNLINKVKSSIKDNLIELLKTEVVHGNERLFMLTDQAIAVLNNLVTEINDYIEVVNTGDIFYFPNGKMGRVISVNERAKYVESTFTVEIIEFGEARSVEYKHTEIGSTIFRHRIDYQVSRGGKKE